MEDQERQEQPGRTLSADRIREAVSGSLSIAMKVITDPASFYRNMPRTGGFLQPLVFMALMGLAGAAVGLLLAIFRLEATGLGMAFAFLILTPILVAIFGFVGAAVVYGIWKIMGSSENYETAYRCVAFASAIMPITTLLGPIPYLGGVLGLLWTAWLLVLASINVHGITGRKAWLVFGTIAVIMAVASLGTEFAGRSMVNRLTEFETSVDGGDIEEMTPEQAGQMVGEFLEKLEQMRTE